MHKINAFKHKKRDMTIRFIMYGILAVFALMMTAVTIFSVQGWGFDTKTGELIQNGVILVQSNPVSADIYINGDKESVRSPARLSLPSDTSYNLELRADGYRNWSQSVDVVGSEVSWVYWPKLIPEVVETDIITRTDKVRIYQRSDNRSRLMVNVPSSAGDLLMYNLAVPTDDPDIVRIPPSLLTDGVDPDLKLIAWHRDGRYAIVEAVTAPGVREFIQVDTERPTRTKKIDTAVIQGGKQVMYGEEELEIYFIKEGILRVFDTETGTARVIDRDVDQIMHSSDQRTYVIKNQATSTLYVVEDDLLEPIVTYAQPITIRHAMTYEGVSYVLLQRGDDQLLLLREPAETENIVSDTVFPLPEGEIEVDSSSDGQFIRISGDSTTIYDLDQSLPIDVSLSAAEIVTWYDDTRLSVIKDGQLFLTDFNNVNSFSIVDINPNYIPVADTRGESVVSVSTSSVSGQQILQVSNLIAE